MGKVEISDNDLRKFFASYWLLHSAIYNFAQGLSNQRNRRFTWSITNYYYSLVFVGRLFMFLATDLYYTGHSNIAKFFIGESVTGKVLKLEENGKFEEKHICGNSNRRNTTNTNNSISYSEVADKLNFEEIEKFGRILKQLKDFRNKNTYESFVIYAQEKHSVLADFMFSAADKVREVTEHYLKDACKIFFNFWRGKSLEFVKLLKHEWLIPTILNKLKTHNLPTSDVEALINRGFYFENEELCQQYGLVEIRRIKEMRPDKRLSKIFESKCDIETFCAKKVVIDDVFSNFKELLKINKEENNQGDEL